MNLVDLLIENESVRLRNIDSLEIKHCPDWTFRVIQETRALLRGAIAHIESQDKRIRELEGALRNYRGEYDTPVPDYTLRGVYRRQLFELLDAALRGE